MKFIWCKISEKNTKVFGVHKTIRIFALRKRSTRAYNTEQDRNSITGVAQLVE